MDYGKAIKTIRTLRGISQVDLSEKTGLSKSYLSKIENGQSIPSMEKLEKVASALKIPFYMLILFASEKQDLKGIPENVANELKENLFALVTKSQKG
jgi:transcriptional regulator with XRE-family HTH domain